MHLTLALALASAFIVAPGIPALGTSAVERVVVNDNRTPAGVLAKGVLTVRLEAREGEWHPDAESAPGIVVRAFAERGKRLQVPGPLLRVPEGTEVHAFVTNTLARGTLTVHNLSARGVLGAADTIQITSGSTREVRFQAGAPGTYYYWATVGDAAPTDSSSKDAELHGAFVVDPRDAPGRMVDRVFVIGLWTGRPLPNGLVGRTSVLRFTINGKTWPNTERLSYAIGDTVRFRVVNASAAVHPMHLHGFYFDVNSRGDGTVDSVYSASTPAYRVVTERTAPQRTFTMKWVPERAGNWLFHCHDNFHVLRSAPFDGTPLPAEQMVHARNHAMEMMGGLVMGIEVRGRERAMSAAPDAARRKLRLIAERDSGGTELEPAYRYALDDRMSVARANTPPTPTVLLKRGEPVSIMVVNRLPEATAVHWHGIELESYFDGVAGFSGAGRHIAPAIAPGDSFEVRFTPPRAGTFMIHPHADETRQQQAGLTGTLLVVDDASTFDPSHDIVLLVSAPRLNAQTVTSVLVNGHLSPTALELRAGQHYRLRLVDVHTFRPSMIARVLRDSATLLMWRPIAKDGMPVPPDRAALRPAIQQLGNGETYDFELTPATPGDLRVTVSTAVGVLLATVTVHVQ